MFTKSLWFTGLAALAVGCVGQARDRVEGICSANADCPSGQVCIVDACRQVCNSTADCGASEVCLSGVCNPTLAGDPPDVSMIVGNGMTPDRFYDGIIVTGSRLSGAEYRLEGAVSYVLTPDTGATDTQQNLTLPTDLQAGDYTLTATNQSGADQMSVSLLAEPRTAAELLTMLQGVDGDGSGLDADLLDGIEASALARTSDLAGLVSMSDLTAYVTQTSLSTTLMGYAQTGQDASFADVTATTVTATTVAADITAADITTTDLTVTNPLTVTNRRTYTELWTPYNVMVCSAPNCNSQRWCGNEINWRQGCIISTEGFTPEVHIPMDRVPDHVRITGWGLHIGQQSGTTNWTCELQQGGLGGSPATAHGTIDFTVSSTNWSRVVTQSGLNVMVDNTLRLETGWKTRCRADNDLSRLDLHTVWIEYERTP